MTGGVVSSTKKAAPNLPPEPQEEREEVSERWEGAGGMNGEMRRLGSWAKNGDLLVSSDGHGGLAM